MENFSFGQHRLVELALSEQIAVDAPPPFPPTDWEGFIAVCGGLCGDVVAKPPTGNAQTFGWHEDFPAASDLRGRAPVHGALSAGSDRVGTDQTRDPITHGSAASDLSEP